MIIYSFLDFVAAVPSCCPTTGGRIFFVSSSVRDAETSRPHLRSLDFVLGGRQ
jgi:hypothetical protein